MRCEVVVREARVARGCWSYPGAQPQLAEEGLVFANVG